MLSKGVVSVDSFGHLLSNSILQIGAMMAVCGDEKMRGMLATLKDTLTAGMDGIRDSIHRLYDDSKSSSWSRKA